MNQESSNAGAENRQPGSEFTDDEKKLIGSIRRQSDAKAAAEKLLSVTVRPKQVRGRCCLFVGASQTTKYFGPDWMHAFGVLLLFRKRHGLPELKKLADAA